MRFVGGIGVALAMLMVWVPGALGASSRGRGRAANADEAAAPVPGVGLSLRAPSAVSVSGHRVVLVGQSAGVPTGSVVKLYGSAYPFSAATLVQTAVLGEDGSFSFAVFPDRDTRYWATVASGMASSPQVRVDVTGVVLTRVKALSLGRAHVTIVVFHPKDLRWGDARTSWWFASADHGRFTRAPATRTLRLSRHVIVLSTTVTLPAGRFRWGACFHAPGDHALEDPGRPPGCSGRGYAGTGYLPVGVPGPAAIAHADRYLRTRMGRTALAIVDSEGRLSGIGLNEQFITGSVVKAMLLVAYLRRLDAIEIGRAHV